MHVVILKNDSENKIDSAEKAFRSAFERLKRDMPQLLQRGTPVSQSNVAREAGRDPSALRKSRYPQLIAEIQRWQRDNPIDLPPSERTVSRAVREVRRDMKSKLTEVVRERDHLASLLLEADAKILELTLELAELRAPQIVREHERHGSNVTTFPHRPRTKHEK
jgi:hypothetical protein